jgi:hypothetical protein
MIKHNQDGAVNGAVISLILTVILLLGAVGFGYWAFSGRQDYKNNSDAKAAAAAEKAVAANSAKKNKQFIEDYKKPLKTYNGPEALGSVVMQFPKTWSGYIKSAGANNSGLDAYFAPGVVPPADALTSVFALRVQVLSQNYSQVLQSLNSQQKGGQLTIAAYTLPKLPKVVGVKVTGTLQGQQTTSTTVVLPLRSQTVEIQTFGTQFLDDFNNYILPNFSFSP